MTNARWTKLDRLRRSQDSAGLLEFLADPEVARDTSLRRHTLISLGRLRDPAGTRAHIEAFKRDSDKENQLIAAYVLANRVEEPDVEPLLIEALDRHGNHRVRLHASRGLAGATSEHAAAALVRALRDPHASVRSQAADSLGWMGISHPEVVPPLAEALGDASRRVRVGASRSLARLGARSALPAMRRARDRSWSPWRLTLTRHIHMLEDELG